MRINKKSCGLWWYIGAFVLSVMLYMAVMVAEKAYPFGSRCFLTDDAYVQYNTMLRTLINYVHSSDKSFVLWNSGMGTDFYLNALYYMMSPFNIIAVILGSRYVELSLILIIVIKSSLIPVTALYYFRHTGIAGDVDRNVTKRELVRFCCAMSWGLCGYIMAYGQNIIWLDALIMLPLIALCIEKINEGTGFRGYVILLALTFVVNFYYSFYVCMFIVMYYILLERDSWKRFILGALKLAGLSVLAVCIAAVVLVPAALCVMKAGNTSLDNSQILSIWGDLGDYIVSFFPFKEITNGYLYNNNNYCGTVVVLLLCVFIVGCKVSAKQKAKYITVMALFMLAANFLPLNYVLHGFVVTHGTGNRFAVILTFVLVIAAYRMLWEIEQMKVAYVIAGGVMSAVIFALSFTGSSRMQEAFCYVTFLLVLVMDIILLVLAAKKSIRTATAVMIICVLWIAELSGNMVYTMKNKANEGDMIDNIRLSEWEAEYNLLNTHDGVRKTAIVNDNYTPASEVNWYSSMINGYYVNAFSSMGLSHFDNVECVYDGATPLTAMMYNVRYVLTNSTNTNGGYHLLYGQSKYNVYEADELSDCGFMVSDDIENWRADGTAAENQSDFISAGFGRELGNMSGGKLMEIIPWGNIGYDVSKSLGMTDRYLVSTGRGIDETWNFGEFERTGVGEYVYSGTSTQYHACIQLKFTADKDMDLYVYSADNRDQAVTVYIDKKVSSEVMYTSSGQLVYGGHVKKGQSVKVSVIGGASVGEYANKKIELYSFNTELFDKVKPYITDETLKVNQYSGNTFTGHVTAKSNGILYMAFPYSDGITVYVDGQKTQKLLLGTGNMGVKLDEGEHDIRLEYHTPGLKIGIMISCAGIILFVLIGVCWGKKRKAADDEKLLHSQLTEERR